MRTATKDKNNKEIKLYSLKTARLLECKIFVDDKLEYEGKYHKIILDGKTTEFYISSEYNNLK